MDDADDKRGPGRPATTLAAKVEKRLARDYPPNTRRIQREIVEAIREGSDLGILIQIQVHKLAGRRSIIANPDDPASEWYLVTDPRSQDLGPVTPEEQWRAHQFLIQYGYGMPVQKTQVDQRVALLGAGQSGQQIADLDPGKLIQIAQLLGAGQPEPEWRKVIDAECTEVARELEPASEGAAAPAAATAEVGGDQPAPVTRPGG